MLITTRTCKKKYVIGSTGIFGSIGNFFARKVSSHAAKQLASAALQAEKTATKYIGMIAVDVIKQLRFMLIRNWLKMLLKSYPHQNHKWLMLWFHQKRLLKK